MPAIAFNQIPSTLRIPIFTAEFDNSQAQQGPALLAYRAILIGQKTAAGSASANSLHRVTRADDVVPLAGRGSMLHRMALAWFSINKLTETWIGVLEDDDAGARAEGSIAVAGTATADGTIALYLGGVRIPVGVTSGDTAAEIAAAIEEAVAAEADLPVVPLGELYTATVGGTATDGDYELEFDGFGLSAPVTVTVTRATTPATNADIAAALRTALAAALLADLANVLDATGGSSTTATYTFKGGLATGTVTPAAPAPGTLTVAQTSASATLPIVSRHLGLAPNNYDMRDSYQFGEELPAGVSLTYVQLTGGTSNPDLDDLIAALGDNWYHIWAHPYTDADSLTAIETELTSRDAPLRLIDGAAITSASGTLAALTTLGESRNSRFSVIVAQPGKNPLTPPMEYAAVAAALAAYYGNIDQARPFQTLEMAGVRAPADADLFTKLERNQLLFDGIATTKLAEGGVVQLERMITTWQTNAAGSPDTSYLDLTTRLTLLYLRYSWNARMSAKYGRHKLAGDDVDVPAGQPVITPKIGKAEAITWFNDMQGLFLVEDKKQFVRDLVVVRSVTDPNRLEWLLPPNLINQLVVAAAQFQFRI